MLRNLLLTGYLALVSSCSACLEIPKWQDPTTDAGSVLDVGGTEDSTIADEEAQNHDGGDSADVQPEDTADRIVDSGSPDTGNPPNSGYINHFDEQNDLASLLFQGGEWSHHAEGYLQQTESNCENGGWRVAEVENLLSSDFEARMRIRMISDQYVRCGVIHNQTGLLFRYSRERQEGAEEETVRGYALIMGRSSADTFVVSLQDFDQRVLRDELINCGEVGCGYNIWREVGVRAVGTTIAVSLDRQELFSVNDDTYHEGRIGLVAFSYNASHFDDVEICPLR